MDESPRLSCNGAISCCREPKCPEFDRIHDHRPGLLREIRPTARPKDQT